jgi:hypothetical protein
MSSRTLFSAHICIINLKFNSDKTGSDITMYKQWKDEAKGQRQYNVNEQAQVLVGRNIFKVLQT